MTWRTLLIWLLWIPGAMCVPFLFLAMIIDAAIEVLSKAEAEQRKRKAKA